MGKDGQTSQHLLLAVFFSVFSVMLVMISMVM